MAINKFQLQRLVASYNSYAASGYEDLHKWLSKQPTDQLIALHGQLLEQRDRNATEQDHKRRQETLVVQLGKALASRRDFEGMVAVNDWLLSNGQFYLLSAVSRGLLPNEQSEYNFALQQYRAGQENERQAAEEQQRQAQQRQKAEAARQEQGARLKEAARSRYPGTDTEFERAWTSGLREQVYGAHIAEGGNLSSDPWETWRQNEAAQRPAPL
jgi:hypothetical protein